MKHNDQPKLRLLLTYLLTTGLIILGNGMYSGSTYVLSSSMIVSALVIALFGTGLFWLVWNVKLDERKRHDASLEVYKEIYEEEVRDKRKKSTKDSIIGSLLSEISNDDLISLRKFIAEKKVVIDEKLPEVFAKKR